MRALPRPARRRAHARPAAAALALLLALAAPPVRGQDAVLPALGTPGPRCEGAACLEEGAADALRVEAGGALGRSLVPALVAAFAEEAGAALRVTPRADGGLRFDLSPGDGGPGPAVVVAPGGAEPGALRLRHHLPQDGPAWGPGVATDGLLVVVAPGNPLSAIAPEALPALLEGRIPDWAALGAPEGPVALHLAAGAEASRAMIAAAFPGLGPLAPGAILHPDDAAVADAVAQDPRAIGLVGFGDRRNARPLALATPCGIVHPPDAFAVKAGEYPFAFPVQAVAPRDPLPLLAFALSDAAEQAIAEAGFVDGGVLARPLAAEGGRLAAALLAGPGEEGFAGLAGFAAEMAGGERLSVTLRRAGPGGDWEEAGLAALDRLARDLAAGRLAGREIVLAGFTDTLGPAEANRAASRRAAEEVAALLRARLPEGTGLRLAPLGFGEVAPLGCPGTAEGRALNRRVEVWTRPPR